MATITVDVDVDLDEFDLDEILEKIEHRYNSHRTKVSDRNKIEEFIDDFFVTDDKKAEPISILDQMKIDYFMANINRITLNDLEKL